MSGERAPRSSPRIRRALEAAWRTVLPVGELGADDNFFDLGGTSADAVDVIATLNRELGTDVSDIGLFERPTIRAMTALLCSARDAGPDRGGTAEREIPDSRRRGERRRAADRARRAPGAP